MLYIPCPFSGDMGRTGGRLCRECAIPAAGCVASAPYRRQAVSRVRRTGGFLTNVHRTVYAHPAKVVWFGG